MLKRLCDCIVAGSALVVLSPIMTLLLFLVWLNMGAPAVFRQQRLGLNEKPFFLYKLRTMTDARGPDNQLLGDAERVTRFGSFLRKYSLDELPQLVNVLKGDMSLVGPRPLLVRYAPFFTETERTRFTVRPGLTGLAQINGRNALAWNERLAYDVDYVQKRSWLLDMMIVWKTINKVCHHEDFVEVTSISLLDLDEERSRGVVVGTAMVGGKR